MIAAMRRTLSAVVPPLVTSLALSLLLPAQQPFALVGGVVYTGATDAPIADAVVVVRDGHIAAVGPAATTPVPADARRVDVAGRFVTPGLIDTHVHYSQTGWADGRPDARDVRAEFPYAQAMADNERHPERFHLAFLRAGVTAVLDCGGYPWTRRLGAATEASPWAPHVVAAGALLATYDPKVLTLPDQSQFVFPADGDAARAAVRSHKAFGSDVIKVWLIETPEHSAESLRPIVVAAADEAQQLGLPLIVHATTLATARVAVDAGAKLLVHSVEDQEVDDAFVAAMRAHGTFYCPTLTVRRGYLQLYAAHLDDEVKAQFADVAPSVRERAQHTEDPAWAAKVNRRAIEGLAKRFAQNDAVMAKNLVRLHAAGVPVVLGTDAGNPLTLHGPSVFVELEAMQAAGLTPREVLTAATRDAAQALGRSDLGRIEVGAVADLLVLGEDPGTAAKAFRSLQQVCRAGVLQPRDAFRPQ